MITLFYIYPQLDVFRVISISYYVYNRFESNNKSCYLRVSAIILLMKANFIKFVYTRRFNHESNTKSSK